MDYLAVLKQLANGFTPQLLSGQHPLEPTIQLIPPGDAVAPNGLGLREITRGVPTLVDVPLFKVDLPFVGKWVRAPNADLPAAPSDANADAIGGMPVASVSLPSTEVMFSEPDRAATAGVPEVLGRVTGTVFRVVEQVQDIVKTHPISVAVKWSVTDVSTAGALPQTASAKYLASSNPEEWVPVPDVIELGPAPAAKDLALRFPLFFTDLRSLAPEVVSVIVKVQVKLSAEPPSGKVDTDWVPLPPVPLSIPTVPVPTILVFCEHQDFSGRKLALVPSDSQIGIATGARVSEALELLGTALNTLAPAHTLISFLAATGQGSADVAANVLKSLAVSTGQTIIEAQSEATDLDAFVFDPGGLFGINRFTGDNMVSSVICLGRPGTVFNMFHDMGLSERITRFQITLGPTMGCAVSRLNTKKPGDHVVYGGTVTSSSPVWENEDRISSAAMTLPAARLLSI